MNTTGDAESPEPGAHPPAPKKTKIPETSESRKSELAREWLIRCNQAPTPGRVKELAPYCGVLQEGTPYERVSSQLVSQGLVPDPHTVRQQTKMNEETAIARAKRRRVRERRRASAAALQLEDREIREICSWIAEYRARQKSSPLWAERGAQFGWSYAQLNGTLPLLRDSGWVTYVTSKRSLRVGRRFSESQAIES